MCENPRVNCAVWPAWLGLSADLSAPGDPLVAEVAQAMLAAGGGIHVEAGVEFP